MTDVNRIIKVSGCHECPNKHYGMDSINCSKVILNEKDYINIDRYVKDKSLPDNCPLERIGDAEARLKNCLAVREDELYYARQDATKHIRHILVNYNNSPHLNRNWQPDFFKAMESDVKQVDREGG